MRKLLLFVYGVAAYAASLATLLYLIGFSAGLLTPMSVDAAADATWVEALVTDLLLLALFGAQHSVMARRSFKNWWTRVVPAAAERSTYLLATCAALALMFRFWVPIDPPVVWRVEHRAGVALLWGLFAFGWLLALVSTFLIDHLELFGLQQVFARLKQRAAPETRFKNAAALPLRAPPAVYGPAADVLVGAGHDGRPAAVRARLHRLHPDRHRVRGA